MSATSTPPRARAGPPRRAPTQHDGSALSWAACRRQSIAAATPALPHPLPASVPWVKRAMRAPRERSDAPALPLRLFAPWRARKFRALTQILVEPDMELDALTVDGPSDHTADLCIVGAGPAGLALARALADAGRRVVLLESGSDEPGEASELN